MKETTRTIQVNAYTDDDGKPVCGDCIANRSSADWCEYSELTGLPRPGPSCPVWHGESKGDNGVIVRMQTMCEESLDPERFEAWEDIKHQLFSNRSSLEPQENNHER